jgi:hypothetical protein
MTNGKIEMYITVKNQKDAIHYWPDAPKIVSHLRNKHRHTFYFETTVQVYHGNRNLEFYMVRDFIQTKLDKLSHDIQSTSCEQLGILVIELIHTKYGDRSVTCVVSEDQQNAAKIVYRKEE